MVSLPNVVSSHPHDGSAAKLLNNTAELQAVSSETVSNQWDEVSQ